MGTETTWTGGDYAAIGGGILNGVLGFMQLEEAKKAREQAKKEYRQNYEAQRVQANNNINKYNSGMEARTNHLNQMNGMAGQAQNNSFSKMGLVAANRI